MMPFTQLAPDEGLLAQANSRNDEVVKAGSGHLGPNALVTWLHFTKENMFHQYFFEAPIDEQRTRIFFVNMRHFLLDPEMDQKIVDINMEIAQETEEFSFTGEVKSRGDISKLSREFSKFNSEKRKKRILLTQFASIVA